MFIIFEMRKCYFRWLLLNVAELGQIGAWISYYIQQMDDA